MLTAVTFRVVPAFLLTAREEPMGWAEVIARLDELSTGANEHFGSSSGSRTRTGA